MAAPASAAQRPHVLREYALLADGERGVIVGPDGAYAWLCVPAWDSDAVFSSLLGGAGTYAVRPAGRFVWGGYYEERSLIWRSRWATDQGIVECREALAFPGHPRRAVMLRRMMARQGPARLDVELHLRGGFGAEPLRGLRCREGVWSGRLGGLEVRWAGGAAATAEPDGRGGHRLRTQVELPEGEAHDLVLELAVDELDDALLDPGYAWEATEHAWHQAVPALEDSVAPRDARLAYAVLRGLTGGGGGMVAAATTSLPERAEQGRNYDYRYAWIRDQCYAGQAVGTARPLPLLDEAVRFVAGRVLEDGPQLNPAYTCRGEPVPAPRTLDLPGYPGGGAIVGNQVRSQFQLDGLGEALLLFATAARHDRLDVDGWRAVETAVAAIAKRRNEPDAGIWEIENRAWAHSRLTCAAGLRAVARAATGFSPAQAADWAALADTMVAEEATSSVHPSGRWQRAPDDPRVDMSLLLPAIRGAVPGADPRSVATLQACRDELSVDFYAYRYAQDAGPLGDTEGAFLLCGYLMALASQQQGDEAAALRWFERNRAACGPPGLFSEEYDVTQRQLRGNLPQAFVHALMLECAVRLARPWEQA